MVGVHKIHKVSEELGRICVPTVGKSDEVKVPKISLYWPTTTGVVVKDTLR
jgi:hypothetical protein